MLFQKLLSVAKEAGRYFVRFLNALAAPIRCNWIFALMMLLLLSLCIWREGIYQTETALHYWHFCLDIYILCAILMLFPRKIRRYVKMVLYAVAYATTFFEIFIMERFQVIFTPVTVNLWRETTPEETKEFFMAYLTGSAFWITLGLLLLSILVHRLLIRLDKGRLPFPAVSKCLISVAIIALVAMSINPAMGEKELLHRFFSSRSQAEKVKSELFYSPVWRLVYSFRLLHIADLELQDLRQSMKTISIDSCSHRCPNIVLVIGESFNKHHAQLYGYKLKTTPNMVRMRKERSLAVNYDAVTPWNLTSKVFKNMLSTHDINATGKWTDGVLFPAIMRKAGYKVAFLTNQYQKTRQQNGVDYSGSFFLNDEDLDTLCFDVRNDRHYALDGDFIKEYEHYQPGPYNFVIFHLYGQHVKYDCRFDQAHRYFTADSIDRKKLNRTQKQVVADYNNATLYNDQVFADICHYFDNDDAIVIYLSDHGEEVYDYIWMFGRTPGDIITAPIAYYEYEIPMVMWFSPAFKANHPDIVKKAKGAYKEAFISSNTSQLILGLAGIHCKWYDSKRDLLSPDYAPGRRMLKGTLPYDSIIAGSQFEKKWKKK